MSLNQEEWGSVRACSWNLGITEASPARVIEARVNGVMQLTEHFDIICLQELSGHMTEKQPEIIRHLSSRLRGTAYTCNTDGPYATLIHHTMDAVSKLERVYPDATRTRPTEYVCGMGWSDCVSEVLF
jgi:endonuclease/exonuclease/phosphatase family metal-dependent hydrolase